MRYLALATALVAAPLYSQSYEHKSQLSPSDYLMNSYGKKSDPVFDQFATIDLGMSFGIGADCGRINMKETLKASFDNILNHEYFEDLSHTIIAGAPMLAACYLSPTWCSILKNTQVNATFLANLRMNQCAAIDKYTDQRVEDYQQQRQQCVRKKIAEKNGNFEKAMNECSGDFYQADIANWAGNGDTIENKLLESSAKWAGFSGQEADRTVWTNQRQVLKTSSSQKLQ